MEASDLDNSSRSDLIARAEALGVDKADVLTRAELVDEIVKRTVSDPIERRLARGLLGVARDLVARVVERGLHLPDAAALIRGSSAHATLTPVTPPIATVTLAEIYATQGHRDRSLAVLDEVLVHEPDHEAARQLRDKIAALPVEPKTATAELDELPMVPIDGDAGMYGGPESDRESDDEIDRELDLDRELARARGYDDDNDRDRDRDLDRDLDPDRAGHASEAPSTSPPSAPARTYPASGMLDDAPLPERYDVDEVVLLAVDATTIFVYWEVREVTYDQARAQGGEGTLSLRIVAVTASWQGPTVETRDIDIDRLVGDCFVRDFPVGAVLRAAIGWRGERSFEPLAVAMDVSSPEVGVADVGADELVEFTAEGAVTRAPMQFEDDELAVAVRRARQRVSRGSADPHMSSSWVALPPAPFEPVVDTSVSHS